MADFVDRVTLHAAGGNGGNGVASIKREKFKPLAGPDGGDGGNGGSVILEVSEQETTLLNYHRSPHRRADNGTPGMGDFRQGKTGADIILPVPEGTVVKSMSGELLADLTGAGARSWSLRAVAAAWATRRWPRRLARPPDSRSWVSRARNATSSWS